MIRLRFPLLLAGFLAFVACGGSEPVAPPPPPTASGNWIATITASGLTIAVNLSLSQDANMAVTGGGTFAAATSSAVSVSGFHNFPTVSLTVTSSGFQDMNYSGTMSADGTRITGTLNGSGFQNAQMNLTKQ